jgi:hypothetical protein
VTRYKKSDQDLSGLVSRRTANIGLYQQEDATEPLDPPPPIGPPAIGPPMPSPALPPRSRSQFDEGTQVEIKELKAENEELRAENGRLVQKVTESTGQISLPNDKLSAIEMT